MQRDWLVAGDEELLEAAVRDAESVTAAELVVVLQRRAEEYRDVPLFAAILGGLAALVFILYHPEPFNEHGILPDVVFAGLLALWLARRTPGLARYFTRAERRRAAAVRAAQIAFVEHGVSATKDRTGILVHYAGLERRLNIVTDFGVQGKVPAARFHAIVAQFEKDRRTGSLGAALATAVRAIGPAVTSELPRHTDDVNELPDRPRVEA